MIDGIISAAFTREHKCTKADLGARAMKDGEGRRRGRKHEQSGGNMFSGSRQRVRVRATLGFQTLTWAKY